MSKQSNGSGSSQRQSQLHQAQLNDRYLINLHFSQGNTAVKLGDWQLALANYNTAMQIDPSIYTYPLNASLMHLKLNQ